AARRWSWPATTPRSWTPCASGSSSWNTARSCGTSRAGCTARRTERLAALVPAASGNTAKGSATMRAQFVLQEVWTGLRRNLTMTVALVVVVAISLSLLGTGLLFVKQVDDTRTYWQGQGQLSIYLCTTTHVSPACKGNGPATAAEKAQIAADLRALPQVEHVYYESQAQAYAHFKQDFSRDPAFTNLVTKSEIPDSFQVKLHNTQTDYSIVAGTVQGRPG